MRNRRLKDEKLENIGRGLLAAGALRESEIDRITARDGLFESVLAKVSTTRNDTAAQPFSFARFVRRHELGIGGAFAAVLCVGVFGLYLQQKPSEVVVRDISVPVGQPGPARSGITPQVTNVSGNTTGRAQDPIRDRAIEEPAAESAPIAERAVYRQQRAAAPARPQRVNTEAEPVKEFYPVTYAGDNGEGVRGGRVIRVDISRATLFAMGINVPLENESPTVKADLLVGPDGVTRAIRLVD